MNKKKAKKPAKKVTKKNSGRTSNPSRTAKLSTGQASNKSGVRPLKDQVLIRPLNPEELGTTTSFGIVIPDTVSKEKTNRGIVVAVGPGKIERGQRITPDVKAGDKVIYRKQWEDPEKIGNEEYYLVSESDILAVLK